MGWGFGSASGSRCRPAFLLSTVSAFSSIDSGGTRHRPTRRERYSAFPSSPVVRLGELEVFGPLTLVRGASLTSSRVSFHLPVRGLFSRGSRVPFDVSACSFLLSLYTGSDPLESYHHSQSTDCYTQSTGASS